MPRPSKGPRLWLRPHRRDAGGKIIANASWVIKDGGRHISTGCGAGESEDAERKLAAYITEKYDPERRLRDIDTIDIADVIHVYLTDCSARQARPEKLAERCERLIEWWGGKPLSKVTAKTCRDYASHRGNDGGSRRDLEDLRAAIRHHAKEGFHRGEVRVTLPEKGEPRDRWLTRDEAAKLLWACWRAREEQTRSRRDEPGPALPTKRWTHRHLARFVLIGLYTGTRSGAILSASFKAGAGRSYIDIESGLFYRLPEGARRTNKRQPPVPIPPRLLAHMRRWHETVSGSGHLVQHHGAAIKSVKTAFSSALEKAGLEGRISPHTLRHTAATWLMQAGVSIWDAAGFLGMSPEMVEKTYGHHHPDYLRNAAMAIGTARKPTTVSPPKQAKQS